MRYLLRPAAIHKQTGLQDRDMRYPIAIDSGSDRTAYGVVIPDLPGCFAAGDTLDEAVTGAEEAAAAWIDAALNAGEAIPAPASLDTVRATPDYAGWTLGVITIDPALLDDTTERVNITLPRRVLQRLMPWRRPPAKAGLATSPNSCSRTLVGCVKRRVVALTTIAD